MIARKFTSKQMFERRQTSMNDYQTYKAKYGESSCCWKMKRNAMQKSA